MELRVVAEDVGVGFLPATGVVRALDLPDGVRVDTGIAVGSVISPFYDSLVAKVIAHGPDRAACVAQLRDALDATWIEGVATNVELLAAVLDEPAFAAGRLHTGFLGEHRIVERLAVVPDEVIAAAAGARSLVPVAADPVVSPVSARIIDPWRLPVPWRVGRVAEPTRWRIGGRTVEAHTMTGEHGSTARVEVGHRTFRVRLLGGDGASGWSTEVDGTPAWLRPAGPGRPVDVVIWGGRRYRITLAPPPAIEALAPDADEPDARTAPMPGRVARLLVAVGDHVAVNAPLVVLEAMKMEHVIAAAGPGRVSHIHVAVGDQVGRGAALVDLEGTRPNREGTLAPDLDGAQGA
jgi:acetyl/propionyl-CoA carboxylase alpha subunit